MWVLGRRVLWVEATANKDPKVQSVCSSEDPEKASTTGAEGGQQGEEMR